LDDIIKIDFIAWFLAAVHNQSKLGF